MLLLASALLLLYAALTAHAHRTPSPTAFVPEFKTSYVCLAADPTQNLCLGVSTGSNAPNATLPMQLKRRVQNQQLGLDFYKMRFDMNYTDGTVCVAAEPEWCVARGSRWSLGLDDQNRAVFNLSAFFIERGSSNVLTLQSSQLCATVVRCNPVAKPNKATQTYCKPPDPSAARCLARCSLRAVGDTGTESVTVSMQVPFFTVYRVPTLPGDSSST